jgi:hypothetical protein
MKSSHIHIAASEITAKEKIANDILAKLGKGEPTALIFG